MQAPSLRREPDTLRRVMRAPSLRREPDTLRRVMRAPSLRREPDTLLRVMRAPSLRREPDTLVQFSSSSSNSFFLSASPGHLTARVARPCLFLLLPHLPGQHVLSVLFQELILRSFSWFFFELSGNEQANIARLVPDSVRLLHRL